MTLQEGCDFLSAKKDEKRTIVLTFDDAVKNNLFNVSPVLLKLGFGSTLFICRFNDDWLRKNAAHLLTIDEIQQLYELGF